MQPTRTTSAIAFKVAAAHMWLVLERILGLHGNTSGGRSGGPLYRHDDAGSKVRSTSKGCDGIT
eukprot:6405759-Amphidinium_carterae.1